MEKIVFTDGRIAGKAEPGEIRTAIIILSLLGLAIIASSILHNFFPSVLDVPSSEGIPFSNFASLLAMDIGTVIMAWFCFRHAWKRLGLYAASIFLGGSFVFTGVEESMFILLGRWASAPVPGAVYPAVIGADGITMVANKTYYFTRDLLWFLETPVTACLGWFFLAYAGVYIAYLLFPRVHIFWKAAIGGFLPMNVDLWVDPVQTHAMFRTWIWANQPGGIWLFGIPITNFIGWFLLIFLFAIVFERLPGMVNRLGYGRAAVRFYLILLALEFFMLFTLGIYGTIEQAVFSPKINITLWGIGS